MKMARSPSTITYIKQSKVKVTRQFKGVFYFLKLFQTLIVHG